MPMISKGAVTKILCAVAFFITAIPFIVPAMALAHDNAILSHVKLANTRDDSFSCIFVASFI